MRANWGRGRRRSRRHEHATTLPPARRMHARECALLASDARRMRACTACVAASARIKCLSDARNGFKLEISRGAAAEACPDERQGMYGDELCAQCAAQPTPELQRLCAACAAHPRVRSNLCG